MWLAKPLYEAVPFYYFAAGLIALLASLYVNYWWWPAICTFVGVGSMLGGLVVWLKRRDYRAARKRLESEGSEANSG